jgi:competence protein ComEA
MWGDDRDVPFHVSRPTALALACALLAVLVLAGNRLAHSGTAAAPDAAAPLEPVTPSTPQQLVVHVVGAVRRPGLYRLREGQRVADAVGRAGGATRKADLTAVNLAAPLVDGTQVLVPARAPAAPAAASPSGASGAATGGSGVRPQPKVSLGSATLEQLDELPGVGPITAQKIVDYRTEHGPFRSVDDLDEVPGIGPATIEDLRDLVTP